MTPDSQTETNHAAPCVTEATPGLVLIADDDDDIREAIAETLQVQGYRVVQARNGAQALHLALELRPAVVLLDHCMPKVAGADVIARLSGTGSKGALVLMSAVTDLDAVARSAGARHTLRKPFHVDRLLSLVSALMAGAE